MRALISAVLVLALPLPVPAAMGILHGEGHVYAISSPPGWQLDPLSGRSRGVDALMYPVGGAWAESEAFFSIDSERGQAGDDREGYVAHWLTGLERSLQEPLDVQPAPSLATSGDDLALARFVKGEHFGYAMFAFLFDAGLVIRLGLTARHVEAFRTARAGFEQMVESYRFLGASLEEIESIPHLIRIADANTQSQRGKHYDSVVTRHFVEHHGPALKQCILTGQRGPLDPFQLLLLVGEGGETRRVEVIPENGVSTCLGESLAGAIFPTAPAPDWWVRLSMEPGPHRESAPPVASPE